MVTSAIICFRLCKKFLPGCIDTSAWCSRCFGTSLAHALCLPMRLIWTLSTCTFLGCALIIYGYTWRMMMKRLESTLSHTLKPVILWNKTRRVGRQVYRKDHQNHLDSVIGDKNASSSEGAFASRRNSIHFAMRPPAFLLWKLPLSIFLGIWTMALNGA